MSIETTNKIFSKLSNAAEQYIENRNSKVLDNSQKPVRLYSKKEAQEHLSVNARTLDRYVEKAGIDPRRHPDYAWMVSIDELYLVRSLMPDNTKKAAKFVRLEHQKTQVVVIQNQKGGVGKTISAVNVAACLSTEFHEEYRVGLIDMDPQATATMYYAAEAFKNGSLSVGDLMSGNFELDEGETIKDAVLSSFLKTTIPNLRILPASQNDRSLEGYFHSVLPEGKLKKPYAVLKELIDTVADEFDVILIDTPPSLGFGTINAYYAGTSVVFPVSVTENDIDATCSYFSYITQVWDIVKHSDHPGYDFMKVLYTNYKSTVGTAELQSRFNDYFSMHVYSKEFKHSEAVKVCSSMLCSLFDISQSSYPKSKTSFATATTNVKEVTLEILSDIKQAWNKG